MLLLSYVKILGLPPSASSPSFKVVNPPVFNLNEIPHFIKPIQTTQSCTSQSDNSVNELNHCGTRRRSDPDNDVIAKP